MKTTFVAVGDAIIQRNMPRGGYPGFNKVQAICQGADASQFNLETTVHKYESYGSQYSGGGYFCANPSVLDDLKKFGFNMTAFANNHTMDYSYDGLLKTLDYVDQSGIKLAGAGRNLQEASKPVYYDSANGRIAVIGVTSSFNDAAIAGAASVYLKGRPGLNPLRHKSTYFVTREDAKVLKRLVNYTHADDGNRLLRTAGFLPEVAEDTITLGDFRFKISSSVGQHTEVDSKDMTRICRSIEEAKDQADFVIVSIHCHEMETDDRESIPEFLTQFARNCIDDGADAIVGHGPHTLRGIEIYQNRPIFYSLGDFILNIQSMSKAPADYFEMYDLPSDSTIKDLFNAQWAGYTRGMQVDPKLYQAVIPQWTMADDRLTELKLTPVELGFDYKLSDGRKGWPVVSNKGQILQRIADLSEPFGTNVKIDNDSAVIQL
ncbi:CapA family protein [Secundilactobacillus folii]|nr:CapA family protein [Secundilactobacillus folii]